MKILFLTLILNVFSALIAVSVPFAKWTNTELTLNNGLVQRIIKLPNTEGNFITTSYKPVIGEFKYFLSANTE